MATAVYALCAIASALCAFALIRQYRRHKTRLLLWSSLSFSGLAVNNMLAFTDFVVVPAVDLSILRAGSACVAVGLLLVGLIWNRE